MYISKKEIREKMQREKLLDPLSDATFKALFADESPEGNYCLSKLLESIIGREISDIKILKNEPSGSEREKPVRFDISCTFNDGEEAEIEVQTHRMNDNFINRSVYYMIRGHRDRLNKGQKYNRLKRYYQINITDFNVIKNDSLLNHFQLRNTEGILLTDVMNVYYLELSKLKKPEELNSRNLKNYELWSTFLKYGATGEYAAWLKKLIAHNKGVSMAQEKLKVMSLSERFWRRQWAREKSRYTLWCWKEAAKEEGREEQRKEDMKKIKEMENVNIEIKQKNKEIELKNKEMAEQLELALKEIEKLKKNRKLQHSE